MEAQNLPATKKDIALLMERINDIVSPKIDVPANKVLASLFVRLAVIERISRESVGIGLDDVPIDAETAAAITGNAVSTIKFYGAHRVINTIKIGRKLQFSLKSCIELVKAGSRKALIDCTTEITRYRRKKRKKN